MRYVQRDKSGKLIGHYANPNPLATEEVEDGHPDIVEWEEWRAAAISIRLSKVTRALAGK
jgi:hypothetical protein